MRNKIISLLMSLVMVIGLIGVMPIVTAGAETSGDYEYSVLTDGTVEITGYTGTDSDLEIPGTLDGKKVTSIGENAFYKNENLISVNIPDGVTSIGSTAFYSCDNITEVLIPNSVTSIGRVAFAYCYKLNSIALPSSLDIINERAFDSCGFSSITIPDSVTRIGQSAFAWCENLESISIPSGVTYMGSRIFWGCYQLTSINVDSNNKNYASVDGVLFNNDKTELMCYPTAKTDSFYGIPNSVTRISNYAFFSCDNLMGITIPNSVTSIGSTAFYSCDNITEILIPNSVVSIGSDAFLGFKDLTIKCIQDSAAHKYAEENSINYELLVGYTVMGNVTSFGSDEDAETIITLTAVGSSEPLYETRVVGTGEVEYSIPNVYNGEYTLSVSKPNHVTRTYDIKVENANVVQDLEIHLIGHTVMGNVTSFGSDEDAETIITLTAVGSTESLYETNVSGTGAVEYSIPNVSDGEYTLSVSKQNHVTRTYDITVGDADITQDLKIHLIGDINGDGKITTADVGLANSHAKGVKSLEGYEFLCADVSLDGKISTADVGMINSHAKGVRALW